MKKLYFILMAMCAVMIVSSCCANEDKSSCGKKCDEQQLQTPDLTMYGLKGNVKSLTDEVGNTYNFTSEGKIDLPDSQIKRDAEGRIVSITIDELTTEVEWDADGNVGGQKLPGQTTTFTYDDRGLLLTSYTEVDSWELSIYKYLKFDDKGNWIERERSWIGFSSGVEEGEDPIYKNKEVEKRTITYFE